MSKAVKKTTDLAVARRERRERQEVVRDKIAKSNPLKGVMECLDALDAIEPDDEDAHFLMAKIDRKFAMQMKLLNKVVGDVRAVEVKVDGGNGGDSQAGVSRAMEILGDLAARGLERDVTPSGKNRSVVSTQIPVEPEGSGGSGEPGLVIPTSEGGSEEP